MLSKEVKEYIDKSILCWLATSTAEGQPNVSPKEVFTFYGDEHLLVANIASPGTVRNIRENPRVSISFVEIFLQKGFQLKGEAELIKKNAAEFEELSSPLLKITKGKYPFGSIIRIKVNKVKPIVAPSYRLFPDITEELQKQSAYNTYGVKPA